MGEFPVYFVQLANFREPADPTRLSWAFFREAQQKLARVPNTGMATAIDRGASNDVHPANKREVGRRLALLTLPFRIAVDACAEAGSPRTDGSRA